MIDKNTPPSIIDLAWARSQERGTPYLEEFRQLAREEAAKPKPAPADTSLYGQYVARMAAAGPAPRVVPGPPPPPAPPPEKTDQQKADEAEALAKAKGIDIIDAFKQLGYWN